MRKILYTLTLLIACVLPLSAERMQIAVLDLQPKDVSKIMTGAITDIIRAEMVKTGLFVVVERGQMNEILKEQSLQMTGCTDSSCAVQIGKLLSAKKILVGEVNKIGSSFMITVRIVDVEKGVSEFAATETAKSEDVLDQAGAKITQKLADNIIAGNKEFFAERRSISGYYLRCLVPGWGQIYAGRDVRGLSYLGGFVLSAGFTAYGYYSFVNADREYNDMKRGSAQSDIDAKYDKKVAASRLFIAGVSLTSAVYIASWVDAIFFSRPDFGEKSASLFMSGPYYLTINTGRRPFGAFGTERVMDLSFNMRF